MSIRIPPPQYGVRRLENFVSTTFINEFRCNQALDEGRDFILLWEVLVVLDFPRTFNGNGLRLFFGEARGTLFEYILLCVSVDDMTLLGLLNKGESGFLVEG